MIMFPRWRIIHLNYGNAQADAQAKHGVRVKVGSIVDTAIPLMIARYTYFVESHRVEIRLNPGARMTGTDWQQLRAAVRERYRDGHHARKPHKRVKAAGKPWAPETAPRPLQAPRIARTA